MREFDELPTLAVPPELRGRAKEGENPALDEWLRRMHRLRLPPNAASLFSAHQMGGCSMGSDPATSVVDGAREQGGEGGGGVRAGLGVGVDVS
mgnify:CR=1 FL=1